MQHPHGRSSLGTGNRRTWGVLDLTAVANRHVWRPEFARMENGAPNVLGCIETSLLWNLREGRVKELGTHASIWRPLPASIQSLGRWMHWFGTHNSDAKDVLITARRWCVPPWSGHGQRPDWREVVWERASASPQVGVGVVWCLQRENVEGGLWQLGDGVRRELNPGEALYSSDTVKMERLWCTDQTSTGIVDLLDASIHI